MIKKKKNKKNVLGTDLMRKREHIAVRKKILVQNLNCESDLPVRLDVTL